MSTLEMTRHEVLWQCSCHLGKLNKSHGWLAKCDYINDNINKILLE